MTVSTRRARRTSLLLCLLVFTAIALTASPVFIAARSQYIAGLNFEKGLHAFGFFLSLVYIVPTSLTAALLCCIAFLLARKSRNTAQTVASVLALACCAFLALAAFPIMGAAFRSGRNRAYREANLASITAGCATLAYDFASSKQHESGYWVGDGYPDEYARLPDEIRALRPADVYVGRRGVVLKMDGGGPALHEGFFVPTTAPAGGCTAFAAAHSIEVLSRTPPVFRFLLYDSQMLPWD